MHVSPAYLAGFFDGEGCIRIQKHARNRYGAGVAIHHQLSAVLANTDRPIMEAIQAQYGGNAGWDQVRRYSEKHAPYHRMTWSGAEAVRLIRIMYPYLIVKRAQADTALAFYEYQQAHHVSGKAYAPDKVINLSAMADKMAALNKRGP